MVHRSCIRLAKQMPSKPVDHNIRSCLNIKRFSDLPHDSQPIHVDTEYSKHLKNILRTFKAPIRYGFAYGSAVFNQGIDSGKDSQVDLIIAVTHPQHWHSLNMKYNPHHYSAFRYLGSNAISRLQDHIGAGVYFNPFVTIKGTRLKYGVVSIDTLKQDLEKWQTLYLAGRLHKPVQILRDEPQISFINQRNLLSALRTALLLLPDNFSEFDLYMKIANLSYMGDFRMIFGENPNKVHNIVHAQFLNFRKLYGPLMDTLPNLQLINSDYQSWKNDTTIAQIGQNMDPVIRGNMVSRLPENFKTKIYDMYNIPIDQRIQSSHGKGSEADQYVAKDRLLEKNVSTVIRTIVRWPAITQSIKGLFTAGLMRSMRYSLEKLSKYRQRKRAK